MKHNRQLNVVWVFLACMLVSSLILVSCAPATPASTTSPVSSQPVAATPKYGGTLKIGIPSVPPSLDPFVAGTIAAATTTINKAFNMSLVKWAGKSDREATIAPAAAKSWEVSPDGLTYTFHIREGVKWQNIPPVNGRELIAEDFAYHLNRVMDPANRHPSRSTLDIKNCEAVDKYTLRVTTNRKSPGFIAYMASAGAIPREVVEAPGGADKNWAGTGAFILTDYERNVRAVFRRNPDYWEEGKPYLDSVEIYFMTEAASRLAAFRAATLDVLPIETQANKVAIEKSVPGAQIQEGIGMVEVGLLFNLRKEPFTNKKVRQALQYAVDYDGLISSAMDGAAMRTGYLAPWFAEWGGKQAQDLPQRDVAKAKAMLAEAGYPDGFKTTILQNTGNMDLFGNAVEPIVGMLREIGVEATIVQADAASFVSKCRAGNYDMTVWTCFTGRPYDPDNSLRQQWYSTGSGNVAGYNNPKVNELIEAQQNLFPDKEKRITVVKELLPILEDEVPAIPLFIRTNYYIKQPWVKGMEEIADPQNACGMQALPEAWIDK